MYTYKYIYIYIYIYIYTKTCIQTYTDMCVWVFMHTHTHTHTNVYMILITEHTCISIYIYFIEVTYVQIDRKIDRYSSVLIRQWQESLWYFVSWIPTDIRPSYGRGIPHFTLTDKSDSYAFLMHQSATPIRKAAHVRGVMYPLSWFGRSHKLQLARHALFTRDEWYVHSEIRKFCLKALKTMPSELEYK